MPIGDQISLAVIRVPISPVKSDFGVHLCSPHSLRRHLHHEKKALVSLLNLLRSTTLADGVSHLVALHAEPMAWGQKVFDGISGCVEVGHLDVAESALAVGFELEENVLWESGKSNSQEQDGQHL